MSSNTMSIDSLVDWSNQATGDFMLLGPGDLQALAHFTKRISAQASLLSKATEIEGAAALAVRLQEAAARLKAIIVKEEKDPESAMRDIAQALEAGQTLGRNAPPPPAATDDSGNSDPRQVQTSAQTEADKTSSSAQAQTDGRLAWVDETILAAYREQQVAMLPELEQQILAYEKERDPSLVASMRRAIHTLKGESGIVGALNIEAVCHCLEDYLEGGGRIATDVLLAAIDWIGTAVDAFSEDTTKVGSESILALFKTPAGDTESPLELTTGSTNDDSTVSDDNAASGNNTVSDNNIASDHNAVLKMVPIGDRELAGDFVAEAQEHFDASDENLLILEKDPGNIESVGAVFRAFHTIKGVAGFLGLAPLGDLAHGAETLLDEVRKGQRVFAGATVNATFDALDHLKLMVQDLKHALERNRDFPVRSGLGKCLQAMHELKGDHSTPHPPQKTGPSSQDAAVPAPPPPPVSSPKAAPRPPLPADAPAPAAAAPAIPSEAGGATHKASETGQTLKVDASRLDLLMDTIGELVIAESIVSSDPEICKIKSLRLEKSLALLSKITRSLQDMGMSMRLVPIDPVFRKMARLVRDLSNKCGKRVNLTIEGGDTELDKSMVDKLGDPLVHMIRNSMDHGIESPEDRVKAGKPTTGNIVLCAYHKGGNIHIDIKDDGRGLNRDAIVAKAIERQLIRNGDSMSDSDVFNLIFEAGFSTAAQVTEISGRGVGMDVVRRNVESLRGSIFIKSVPGQGSVFTLALPLTTAIIDGMLARIGTEVFILPTLSILESFRPKENQSHMVSGKGEIVSFRDNLLPLFRLSEILSVPGAERDLQKSIVIVVEEVGKQWGFVVDELLGQQQIVIKNLGDGVGQIPGISGCSILADGRPGLVLDTGSIVRLASAN